MANAKMIVSEESWKNIPESERLCLIHKTVEYILYPGRHLCVCHAVFASFRLVLSC